MIQRIQSVFLLVAMALQALLFNVNFYSLQVASNDVFYSAWKSINTGSQEIHTNVVHIILQFLLIGMTGYTIFGYRNRSRQMKHCLYLALGTMASFALCLYNLFTTNFTTYHFGFGTYIASMLVLLYICAYFFIRKDDNLVKSVDRLR